MKPAHEKLERLGWTDAFEDAFDRWRASSPGELADAYPARVILEERELFTIHDGTNELPAQVAGKLRHEAHAASDFPAVGDWVCVVGEGRGTVHAVLPRRSCFSRQAAGARAEEQIVAANVDTVFLVSGLDGDFNPRRIERYLTATWDCGADPVIVLNKLDVPENRDELIDEAESISMGVPVLAVSAETGEGLTELEARLRPGATIAFVGSSGVGKSTLINRLIGSSVQETQSVRDHDSRGRHTTTRRQLFVLEGGALLLDTPGMRELQLWASDADAGGAFEDIVGLAARCRYRDCGHQTEDGCAVLAAIESGDIARERLESYRKLEAELDYAARKQDPALMAERNREWAAIHRQYRKIMKQRDRD